MQIHLSRRVRLNFAQIRGAIIDFALRVFCASFVVVALWLVWTGLQYP